MAGQWLFWFEELGTEHNDVEWAISDEFPKGSNIFFLQTRPAIIAEKKSATDTILDLILSRRT